MTTRRTRTALGTLLVCALAATARAQVDVLQDIRDQQQNTKDLHAAYCVGVLTAHIRFEQRNLNTAETASKSSTREIRQEAEKGAAEARRAIARFQDLRTRYQMLGVPRMDAPGPNAVAAARRQGEADIAKAPAMVVRCSAKCGPVRVHPVDKKFNACFEACKDPALERRLYVCETGQ